MKTSNKLLLFFFLFSIALFIGIHLALYANYRNGVIRTEREIDEDRYDHFSMQSPKYLSLKGHLRVTIVPSDSFRIELDRNARELSYRRMGDSVIIDRKSTGEKNPHGNWNDYWNLPLVNIFCPPMQGIRVEDGYVSLTNTNAFPSIAAFFTLQDAQLWIGEFDPIKDSVFSTESFDSLSIDGRNSTVVVNRQSHVRRLRVRLDNLSDITDRFARIDTGWVDAGAYSKIYMTGTNYNKINVRLTADANAGNPRGPWRPNNISPPQSVIVNIKRLQPSP